MTMKRGNGPGRLTAGICVDVVQERLRNEFKRSCRSEYFLMDINTTRPRVGIDFTGASGAYQGTRTHVNELFPRLISISPELDFILFVSSISDVIGHDPAFALPNVYFQEVPKMSPYARYCAYFPVAQRKYSLGLLHTQYLLPLPNLSPSMVTIHDNLYFSYPQYFPWFFRFRSKFFVKRAARLAVKVFTVSEHSRTEISRHFGIPREKIQVIYNAVDHERFFPGNSGSEVLRKRDLSPHSYILFVGRPDPRKNLPNLLRAYSSLAVPKAPLVLVCPQPGRAGVYSILREYNLASDDIKVFQDVRDDELPSIYRHAKIFVCPSFAEGFGMPLLEAMASGVPVITSCTTSMPEVVGEAAILIDPMNADELTARMENLLNAPDIRAEMASRGLRQARIFSWAQSARTVKDAYMDYFRAHGYRLTREESG